MLFVDGHVEVWSDPSRSTTNHGDVAYRAKWDDEHVFDIGTTDELWDLD